MLASSVPLALLFLAQPPPSFSVDVFDNVSIGGFAGWLFGVLVLVAAPVLMLGAVLPWAIGLELEASGTRAGPGAEVRDFPVARCSGTFSASLLLSPPPDHRTFLTFAILLAVAAALGLGRRWALASLASPLLLLVPVGSVEAAERPAA